MPDIRRTLARFKALLPDGVETDQHAPEAFRLRKASLIAQIPIGSNTGNLGMYVYSPDHLPSNPPLVVALHGCGQSASDYDRGTGWSQLAARHGFVVLYPEQQAANNNQRCFSWFQPGDIGRDLGEARSIHEMVEQTITRYNIDRRKVFITGLSAGGAMAAVMLATYPEVYASGAIIAGLPYGSASSIQEAVEAMFNDQQPSHRALGDRVRAATRHQGPWPRVSVWHGTADKIVRPSNGENLIRQWSNVHGVPVEPSRLEYIGSHTRRIWEDVNGDSQIEAISIVGMGHGVPLATQISPGTYGVPGPFFLDVGVPSTVHIAEYFGVDDVVAPEWGGAPSHHSSAPIENPLNLHQIGPLEPNAVIAAAFQAAGLPIPAAAPGKKGVDPNVIIQAVLENVGLRRR